MNKIINPYSHLKNKIHIKIDPTEIRQWNGGTNYELANDDIVTTLENKGWTVEINKGPWRNISGSDYIAELEHVEKLVTKVTTEVAENMENENKIKETNQKALESLEAIRDSLESIRFLLNKNRDDSDKRGCVVEPVLAEIEEAIDALNE